MTQGRKGTVILIVDLEFAHTTYANTHHTALVIDVYRWSGFGAKHNDPRHCTTTDLYIASMGLMNNGIPYQT